MQQEVTVLNRLAIADIVTEVAQHPSTPIEHFRKKYGMSGEEWNWLLWACFPAMNYRSTCVNAIKMLDQRILSLKMKVKHWGEDVPEHIKKQVEREIEKMQMTSEELWKNLDVKLMVKPEDEVKMPNAREAYRHKTHEGTYPPKK